MKQAKVAPNRQWFGNTRVIGQKELANFREELQTEEELARIQLEAKRQAREEREKRRQQNELRGTVYQEVKNTSILKTMSKKQLRQIKKTQVTKHGEVELVGAEFARLTKPNIPRVWPV